MSFVINVKIAG
jgi:hypothetical protein